LDQFLDTLWDTEGHDILQRALYQTPQRQEDYQSKYYTLDGIYTANIRRMLELQDVTLERRLKNITRMAENIEIAQGQKLARRARLKQQNDKAEQRRIEKAQRN
jgi:hypothetical protein